jgi:hypothetical protein
MSPRLSASNSSLRSIYLMVSRNSGVTAEVGHSPYFQKPKVMIAHHEDVLILVVHLYLCGNSAHVADQA